MENNQNISGESCYYYYMQHMLLIVNVCNVGGNMMGPPPEISIEWENVEIEVKVMGPHQLGGGYVR